ncbi:MAG: phosphate ABC transporter substrate-binding protein [Alphaproteobacteria bacterium]|nr:phosphate ABC transporter substrate-binding protein [Alphaproteobacteria bacterium]MAS47166.1 phosphate ABC transporter substrate-binding protein [Alphaproteobacteria bacterium]MBN53286.1 phosphate ABC transporter substrate-binding protein [Alphaproteobacteria bacterium]OUT41307.1 MAG: phosphate ABC transporter substrate-binding protein [Micavibrio sp. TMED2]|tara:strand:- start:7696 stop:8712 length:1017 start_codon:yes stop_codon:yes gene_type:complete
MNKLLVFSAALAVAGSFALADAAQAQSRDRISIVGSSTVFPFSTAVAENFGRVTSYPTPKVESTGSGGGLKLFCAGVGTQHPDITNASRAIKSSEIERCASNGVEKITEIKIGYDGIVLANSNEAPRSELTREQIFLALAKEVPQNGKLVPNPYKHWSDIDKSLSNKEIEVLGPPPTSGTRDAFVELVMEEACENFPEYEGNGDACAAVREDGAYVEAGENDNLIVQKLQANHNAYGIFGFSFLDQNADVLQGSIVDGSEPTFDNIADGNYPVSRSLYFYVKNAHVGVIPGIEEYLAEFTSERAMGPDGYLAERGLIPLPADMREQERLDATNLRAMN